MTREELLNIIETDHVQCGEAAALARIALSAMDSEPVAWREPFTGRCVSSIFYQDGSSPLDHGYEPLYSAPQEQAHLYRHAQPVQVAPDENYQQLSDLYHEQEKRLFKIAQCIKGPTFDKYSHSPSQAIDVLEETMHVLAKYYRWLAVHSEPHPKPEVYATDWDSCRKRDDEYQKLNAGIDFSNASMMIRGCSSEHSDIPNGGNYQVIPGAKQRIADAVDLLKQAAPAMLADNGGPDGPLTGRLKSPVIPEGYVMVPKEPTEAMLTASYMFAHVESTRESWDAMLAAATQSPGSEPATAPGKWIPVDERMPEIRKGWLDLPVIIAVRGEKDGAEAMYCSDGKFRWGRDEQPIDDVTHWMLLPAAPQEVK